MKIAIVGGGISGLVAAYRLAQRHEVTLFEANQYIGGHTNTVDIEVGNERHAIDTGFIVFNDWTYPNFIDLLNELQVESKPTCMGFSVRSEATGLEYNGSSLNGLFSQRTNLLRPRFWRMVRDILRFNRQAPRDILDDRKRQPLAQSQGTQSCEGTSNRLGNSDVSTQSSAEMTIGQYLKHGRYSREFADYYLLPMGSAIWSCPVSTFEEFPIRFIVEFYQNHGLLNVINRPTWRVVCGGSRTYVQAILTRFKGIVRTNSPVTAVRRSSDRVEIQVKGEAAEQFDHVVFGCHADQALRILADPTPTERSVLSSFPYSRNLAFLHTDQSVLPKSRRSWASWNYFLPNKKSEAATVTYCMNILQGLQSKHVFNVSLNCEDRIDPKTVLGRFEYEHPIFTTERAAAQSRRPELLANNRTSFCGAYWGNGFHEDGVVSALAVCRAIQ